MRNLAVTIATGMLTSAIWAYVVRPWLDREGESQQGSSGTVRGAYEELNDENNPLRSV